MKKKWLTKILSMGVAACMAFSPVSVLAEDAVEQEAETVSETYSEEFYEEDLEEEWFQIETEVEVVDETENVTPEIVVTDDGIATIASYVPNLNHKGYSSSVNPYVRDGFGGQCTAFVWGRTYEKLGISLPFVHSGIDYWTENVQYNHYSYGSTPAANSIAVWRDGGNGHVAFVEEVSGSNVIINEANWDTFKNTKYGGGYDGSSKTISISGMKTRGKNGNFTLCGYIYLQNSPASQIKGSIDEVSGGEGTIFISGWTFDEKNTSASLYVDIYIGGPAGASGTESMQILANKPRGDVNTAYPGVGNNHGFEVTINTKKTGSVPVYIYVHDAARTICPLLGTKTATVSSDKTAPKVSDVTVDTSFITAAGFAIYCKVSDNVGVTNVKFPTWIDGSSDVIWYEGGISGNEAFVYIPLKDFNYYIGTYHTHIYVYDASGNYTVGGIDVVLTPATLNTIKGMTVKEGTYCLRNAAGKALDINGGTDANGTRAESWPYHGESNQRIRVEYIGDGKYRLVAAFSSSSRVIDVNRGSSYNDPIQAGCTIDIWQQNDPEAQEFYLTPWGDGSYAIELASKDNYVIGGTESYNGAPLLLQRAITNALTQRWYFYDTNGNKVDAAQKYTVSYNANGGTGAPSSQAKTVGQTLTLSSTKPTKTYTITYNGNGGTVSTASKAVSCTFKNWNTAQAGTGTSYNPGGSYTADANATLYAQWTNPTVGSLATASRSGYTFDGWYTSASGGSKVTTSTTVTANMTLYAHWTQNSTTKYTISYNANGGTGAPASQTKTSGQTLTLSSTKPTKTYKVTYNGNGGTVSTASKTVSCTFKNWNTAQAGTGTSYNPGGSYTANANATLYAQWTNPTAGSLATASRSGYTFDGWYTSASGGNKVTTSTTVTGNMTLYAHWTAQVLPAVTGLKATGVQNGVKVSWNKVDGATGYIIYRQIGSGSFSYLYMVTGTEYVDTTALCSEYNFYRIYPYIKVNDTRVLGKSDTYVYAKKQVLPAVTGLKAQELESGVKVSWNKVAGATGYIIYRRVGDGSFQYLYLVAGTEYLDSTASRGEYNFYRIYPYHMENGSRILGKTDTYVYGRKQFARISTLSAKGVTGGVEISWTGVEGATGYIVYGKRNGSQSTYEYIGLTTGTTYTDKLASKSDYNFYWVYPYVKISSGDRILGKVSTIYTYAKAK